MKDILKGKFLVEESAITNWRFMLMLFLFAFVMITSTHLIDGKVKTIDQKEEKLDEVKARYALIHSRLLKLQLESELIQQVKYDSLYPLEDHPIKIVVE